MEETISISIKNERLLKVDEVSHILNISRAMTYRLIQQGEIPGIRINHAVRVQPSDLNDYINKCRSVSTSTEL